MRRFVFAVLCLLASPSDSAYAQRHITSPREALGANFGDDYFLASYRQIAGYWKTLAGQSDRMRLVEIGRTAEGNPHLMAIVSSPANLARLERYRAISARLAHAEGLTDDDARLLAREGTAVVWIDGGLHATETVGAQQLGQMVYEMVSRNDAETKRILDDVIVLFVHANPDGNDLVADWYMRNPNPRERSLANLPKLYQKYIGHDDNRDFFMSTQVETENENRVLYHQWFPQILYNHHQSGPAGTVVYSPPLRDPYNYNLDPVLILGLQSVGAAMHTRLAIEGKGGATMRSGGPYDGWWNGGIRNTATFHNTIAMLTEIIGNPTPMRIPLVLSRQIPSGDLALPIAPQEWHMKQSIDYSLSLNRAVLDFASRMRENLLFNIYRMGRSSIERGSRDTWTANPRRDAAIAERVTGVSDSAKWAAMHAPELRDPRGYVIPSDQRDFPTATKFVNALLETGITVQRATTDFSVNGKRYPSGSYVVRTAQAFRPHVMDMFEPQVHPDVFPFPGAPPTPPYDNAGWTLAFQMGIQFDRILEGFNGPFEKIGPWQVAPAPGRVATSSGGGTSMIGADANDAFIAVNRALKAGHAVSRANTGNWYVDAPSPFLDSIRTLGLNVARGTPPANATKVRAPRIGLWDNYGGSMPSGWTRWLLEQFEFPYSRVFAPQLDRGTLSSEYDVLVFVTGAIPGSGTGRRNNAAVSDSAIPYLPEAYRSQMGRVTAEHTLPKIREFIETGGTVVAIGSSATNLAEFLKLPVESQLVENGSALPRTKFYVPGSLLSARIDSTSMIGLGMPGRADFFFDDSPVFRVSGGRTDAVHVVAWYDSPAPLRSGWAWGQSVLNNGIAAAEIPLGKGRVILFGPEVLQRGQPHGTFKLFFNALFAAVQ